MVLIRNNKKLVLILLDGMHYVATFKKLEGLVEYLVKDDYLTRQETALFVSEMLLCTSHSVKMGKYEVLMYPSLK
jgi:hypothetical protein